jgi:protein O-mannosyl-transferase
VRPGAPERLEAAALLAAGVAVWAGSFAGVFQFDDFRALLGSGRLGGAVPSWLDGAGAFRPLSQWLLGVQRGLFGFDPLGDHLLRLGLHLASTLLVWRLGRDLTGRRGGEASPLAFAAAALFLVHPLATEAVTYLSGFASLLAGFLSLLTIDLWRRRLRAGGPPPRWPAGGSLAAFALALAAKETAAAVLLALPLVDLVAGGPGRREPIGERLRPYLAHALVLALFLAAASFHAADRRLLAHSLALRGPAENLILQPRVVCESAALFVLPGRLNLDHDLRPEAVRADGTLPACAAALLALTLVALRSLRRSSLAGFGWLWFLVFLAPTCSFVARGDLLSERNLYLPAAGLCFVAAAAAARALERLRPIVPARPLRAAAIVAAAALAVALAGATIRRNALYADPVALWRDAVRKSPAKARPHANLGWSLYVAGDLDAAIEQYREALRLDPDDALARRDLALAWEQRRHRALADPAVHVSAPRRPAEE